MTDIVGVFAVLATLSFFLEVVLERFKVLFPFIKGTKTFTIKNTTYSIAPLQFITLGVGILLMFLINQPISVITASTGYEVPQWFDNIVNGFIISGGSGVVHTIQDKWIKENNGIGSDTSNMENGQSIFTITKNLEETEESKESFEE